jgi:hypothetical protein
MKFDLSAPHIERAISSFNEKFVRALPEGVHATCICGKHKVTELIMADVPHVQDWLRTTLQEIVGEAMAAVVPPPKTRYFIKDRPDLTDPYTEATDSDRGWNACRSEMKRKIAAYLEGKETKI